MSDDFKEFPKGGIAMGSGDLMQVLNFKLHIKTSAKLKFTLRSKKAVGFVLGKEDVGASFEFEIPAEGQEADYVDLVRTGKVKTIRFKVPGKTYTVTGTFVSVELDAPLDDAVKGSVELIGIMGDN
jgi:hypothetical protein